MINLSAPLEFDSIVNGEGLRTVIWTQGCLHNCDGCHNPTTHSLQPKYMMSIDEVVKQIDDSNWYHITFSGGDPILQPQACARIARHIKEHGGTVWCYTGYTLNQLKLKANPAMKEFLSYVDVLVDGPYIESCKTYSHFRGSSNQKILYLAK